MRRFLVCTALALGIFAGSASAALASVTFQGYAVDATGHPVSGAYVTLYKATNNYTWGVAATCYSGSGGYYNCGSHPFLSYYYATAQYAPNCSMWYGFFPDIGGRHGTIYVGNNNVTVTWYIGMNYATRIC